MAYGYTISFDCPKFAISFDCHKGNFSTFNNFSKHTELFVKKLNAPISTLDHSHRNNFSNLTFISHVNIVFELKNSKNVSSP